MYKVQFKEQTPYGGFIYCESFEQRKTGYEFLIRYTFKNVLYEKLYNIPSIRKEPVTQVINGKTITLQNKRYSLRENPQEYSIIVFYDRSDYRRLTKLETLNYQEYPNSNIVCIAEVSNFDYNDHKFENEYVQEFENLKKQMELEIIANNQKLDNEIAVGYRVEMEISDLEYSYLPRISDVQS